MAHLRCHRLATLLLGVVWFLGATADNSLDTPPPLGTVIGIDLGTTYSCVGVFQNGRVEIIPNDQGNRITPSYVAWDATGERFIGDAAKNQATVSPQSTVFDAKRLIGRLYSDPAVQADKKLLPYSIISKEDRPFIKVDVKGATQVFSPEEISAMVLSKMRSVVETFLGKPVQHAVITVPAYFNDAQRQATKDAGTISGLAVQRIINEPTAAAIAYGVDKRGGGEKTILVFDLGGGTFDVTLLSIDNGVFEVLATNGDTHLGGEDFDQRVMRHCMQRMDQQRPGLVGTGTGGGSGGGSGGMGMGKRVAADKRAMQKLRREVERVKRALSTQLSARLEVEDLVDGEDYSDSLTRAKFEELCGELFKKTLVPVRRVLEDADVEPEEVDELVLVGGSTRIPKVRSLLSELFGGKEPSEGVNPDEAVAFGAAVQGGILSGEALEETKGLLLLDVTPLTLGKEIVGGVMSKVILRNTVIPVRKSKDYTTTEDFQTSLRVSIYEGERAMVQDNHKIGEFHLRGIPPAPRGVPSVEVTFEVDANGILQVTALDKATKQSEKITITAETGRLSEEDIARMVSEAEEFAKEDKRAVERVEAANKLEVYLHGLKETVQGARGVLASDDFEELESAVRGALRWLAENEGAEDKEDFEGKLREVERIANPIIRELYAQGHAPGERQTRRGRAEENEEEVWEDDPEL